MRTILFDSRAAFMERQSRMHKNFLQFPGKNIRPVSVFHDYVSFKKFKNLENTELLSLYWEEGSKRYSRSELIEIEKKYGIVNLWNIVASDRFIKNWKEETIIQQISFYFYAWEKILEKYSPDYVISETVTGLWNYTLFLICHHKKIKYLSIHTTKNTGRYYFSEDQFGTWKEFESRYNEILKRGLRESEAEAARKFIIDFRKNLLIPPYMKSSMKLPNFIKYINIPRFFINLKKDLEQNWLYDNHDYKIGYRTFDYIYTVIRSKRIIHATIAKFFQRPEFANPYVLYPVHYQPEATTDIWAPYFSDQVFIIKSIARSLPFGYFLYVKEHSAMLGSKPISFYRDIMKIPNVKLIDPWYSISELIKNAAAIATITSTTGLESIFWNRPVVIFGKVFYTIYPKIFNVNSLNDLPWLIPAAINQKSEEDLPERLAFAYLYSTMGYKSDIYSSYLSEEDIVRFCDELLEEVSKG